MSGSPYHAALRIALLVLSAALHPFPRPARADTPSPSAPLVQSVGDIAVTVSDLDRSVAFFRDILDFTPESEYELRGDEYDRLHGAFGVRLRVATLRLGDERLQLRQFLTPRGRLMPRGSRSNDRWFQHIAIIVSDMDRAFERLRDRRVEFASTAPQTLPAWNKNAAGIQAFYFRDPDGHFLEILAFPPDKGDARWHSPTDRLFLGIDHTAIVVADTDASLRLYRDTLGMAVAGESENYGPEQDHLNHVFGARLRITTLRAARGPAIELLEYVTPRNGRPYPADSRPTDLWEWTVHLHTGDAQRAAQRIHDAGFRWISPGVQTLATPMSGTSAALMLRDPDGHALMTVEVHQPEGQEPRYRAPATAGRQ